MTDLSVKYNDRRKFDKRDRNSNSFPSVEFDINWTGAFTATGYNNFVIVEGTNCYFDIAAVVGASSAASAQAAAGSMPEIARPQVVKEIAISIRNDGYATSPVSGILLISPNGSLIARNFDGTGFGTGVGTGNNGMNSQTVVYSLVS